MIVLTSLLLSGCARAPAEGDSADEVHAAAMDALEALRAATHRTDCPPGQVHEYDMYVNQMTPWQPWSEKEPVPGFAFGLSPEGPFTIPAPTLRVTQCDTLRVNLHLADDQFSHTIHWHGITLPWTMDGVPYVTQEMGRGVFTYEFQATESGTYWYHCHVEAPVHVDAGMYGALIVDPLDPSMDLPYDREAIMMLGAADMVLFRSLQNLAPGATPTADTSDQNAFDAAHDASRTGRAASDIGGFVAGDATGQYPGVAEPRPYYNEPSLRYRPEFDTFMINGKSYPDTEPIVTATDEVVRIRLINAAPLVHTMHLHGHHFLVTHRDGYPLLAPFYADTLTIGPAERYDIYVVSDNPGLWDFHDHGGGYAYGGHASNEYAFPGGMSTMFVYEDLEDTSIPDFEVTGAETSGAFAAFAPSGARHGAGHGHH